jgi:fumarate reductase subunit D
MLERHPEPVLWLLFSAGGVLAAVLMPVLALVFGVAIPLDWLAPPSYERVAAVLANPLTRMVLLTLFVLSLVHWAHRFRHTLYDGLQIKHLNELIAVLCYGGAVVGSVVAAYVLW